MKIKMSFNSGGTLLGGKCGYHYINCDVVPRVGELISLLNDKEFTESYPNDPVRFIVMEVIWFKEGEELKPEVECAAFSDKHERLFYLREKGWLPSKED